MFVSKDALLDAYNAAGRRDGRPAMPMTAMTQALARLRPSAQVAQRLIAGKMTRVWLGIGLKGDADV